MPEESPKVFDITKPTANPTSRPIITGNIAATDPMVTAAAVSIPVQQAGSTSQSVADEPKPEIANIPVVTAPPPETPVLQESVPTATPEPSQPIMPALPGAPQSDFSNIPKFGELQAKVDAHPLFSGKKESPIKVRRRPRWLWPAATLLVLLIIAYLAVDAGLVRGASHLPFHVFKQATPIVAAPVIMPQQNTVANTKPTSTPDPYAGWKAYSSTAGQFSLKYPSTWVVPDNTSSCTDGLLLLAPDAQSLGKCGTESSGEVSFLSVAGNQSASYQIKATDGYTNVTTESVTVQGVAGTKYTGTAQGQQDKPGAGGLPDNTKVIVYVFYTGGKTYVSTYNQTPSYPDASSDFDKIVTGTLKFSS